MLLDEPERSGPQTPPPPSRLSTGRIALIIALIVMIFAAFKVLGRSSAGSGSGAVTGAPVLPNDTAPPPTIFEAQPGPAIASATGKAWAICANASFQYWFEYPTAWNLSIPPCYDQQRARMLVPSASSSLAILVIPFTPFSNSLGDELKKVENAYLATAPWSPARTRSSW